MVIPLSLSEEMLFTTTVLADVSLLWGSEVKQMFIEAGIPSFVDKPLTRNVDEAIALMRLAKEKQASK